MENGVKTLDARDGNVGFLSKLQRRSEVGFNLHRALGFEVEPHSAVIFLWLQHLLQRHFPKVGWENTLLRCCESKQLVQNTGDESANANLLKKFCVIWCFKEDTGRVKRDWSALC
jgi:hypothetical protein